MTMRARLERLNTFDGPGAIVLPAPLDPASSGIIIRLVLERPASKVGQHVDLHIRGDEVLELLGWMRSEATRQRNTTETEALAFRQHTACGTFHRAGEPCP